MNSRTGSSKAMKADRATARPPVTQDLSYEDLMARAKATRVIYLAFIVRRLALWLRQVLRRAPSADSARDLRGAVPQSVDDARQH